MNTFSALPLQEQEEEPPTQDKMGQNIFSPTKLVAHGLLAVIACLLI